MKATAPRACPALHLFSSSLLLAAGVLSKSSLALSLNGMATEVPWLSRPHPHYKTPAGLRFSSMNSSCRVNAILGSAGVKDWLAAVLETE